MDDKKYKSILTNVPFGYAYHKVIVDEQGKPTDYEFLEVNPAFERITGLKAKKIIGKTACQVLPGIREGNFDWIQYYGNIALDGGESEFEQYSKPLDSWYKVQANSDQKYYFSTVFIDITAHKSLSDIAATFNNFSARTIDFQYVADKAREISGAAFAVLNKFDVNGRDFSTIAFSGMNKYIENVISILGFDFRDKKWDYDPARQKKIDNQKTTIFKQLTDLTGTVIPGKIITLLCKTFNIGQVAVVKTTRENTMLGDFTLFFKRGSQLKNQETLETYADLTGMLLSRIDDERKVLDEQARLKTITDNMTDLVWETDLQANTTYISPSVERILGFSVEEYKSLTLEERLVPETLQILLPLLQEELEKDNDPLVSKSRSRLVELEYYKKDGSIVPLESNISFVRDENGKPVGLRGVSRDITDRKRAEIQLQKAKDDLQTISDNMLDLVAVTDMRGNYKFAGSSHKILGYEIEYFLGKNVMDFVHPEDLPGLQAKFVDFITNKKSTASAVYRNRCADGSYLWFETIGTLISDNDGNPKEILFNTRNITDRKQSEEALHKSEELLNASQRLSKIGGWAWDVETQTMYWTKEAYRIHDFTPGEMELGSKEHINRSLECYEPEDRPVILAAFERCMEEGYPYDLEVPFTTAKGRRLWVRTTARPISESGKVTRVIGNIMDITEYKQAEQKIIAAKEKAEESDRLKSAFLANMSHEIRTPMNGILGFAELMKSPGIKGEEQQKYIGIIEKSGKRMLNIINDIVDISKIEAGLMNLDMKETNVNEQIEYIYTFFKPEAEAKGMNLSFKNTLPANEAFIKTDSEKVYAILTNLVKNAIKYTEKGSIEIGYIVETHRRAALLQFYVKDTGIGIPEYRQEAIFERFIQADIEDRMAYQGAGLGLAITKAYVEMLGGKIWVESEEGEGSTFYFTLPYNLQPGIETNSRHDAPSEKDETVRNLKILIAEDDEVSEMLLDETVKMFGNEILKARTGVEAVEACRDNPDIDLILMDIQMPGMGGYEATRKIREFNKEVIIIAQTAYGLTGDREKSIESGCNDYLAKPINEKALKAMIQKYFGK